MTTVELLHGHNNTAPLAANGGEHQAIVDTENRRSFRLHDNLDDRRELLYLLERVSPERRKLFLAWACAQCRGVLRPKVAATTAGEALEVFMDLWGLSTQWGLDLGRTLQHLERCVSSWTR